MFVLNILCGPAKWFAVSYFRTKVLLNGGTLSSFMQVMVPVSFDLAGLCEVVSGVMLIQTVLKIRRYFKERNAEGFINTAALIRHAICFGLYLLTIVAYFGTYTLFTFKNTAFTYNFFVIAYLFWATGSTVSQLLLFQILWSLGTKSEVQEDDE